MPLINALKNVMLNEEVDIKVIDKIMKLSQAIGYHDSYFVSSAGNNTDGKSWETAYTSLSSAMSDIASNQASSGQIDVVFLGVGSHDLNRTTAISDNIVFIGSGKHFTTLTNTASSLSEVIKSTGLLGLFDLTVDIGATAIEGIYISGTSANGSIISNVFVDCDSASGAQSAIYLDSSVVYVEISNTEIEGVAANTTAIHFNDANKCMINDVRINTALIGIHLDHADDDNNTFRNIIIDTATTGIQIDNATSTGNQFENISFISSTTNMSDSGTSTILVDININTETQTLIPSNLTGQTITAGVGANTYSAATQIYAAASATKPFKVLGIIYENAAAEKYGIKLSSDAGTSYFWEGIVETAANVTRELYFSKPFIINQGTAIHGAVKSETGGNNSIIWLMIATI